MGDDLNLASFEADKPGKVQPGNLSNPGASLISSSQTALLAKKICVVGSTGTGVSRHPAGTTSRPDVCASGNAEPHNEQKLLACRVPGSVNDLTTSAPDSQMI